MPFNHTGTNAILHFANRNKEVTHGADLVCSHSLCFSKGVKFRYCLHCNKAVAKRNFRRRHAHPEIFGNKQQILTLEHDDSNNMTNNRNVTSTTKKKEEEGTDQPTDLSWLPNTHQMKQAIDSTIPEAWAQLYHLRPKNGDKEQIKIWLMHAMRVADVSSKQVDELKHPSSEEHPESSRQHDPTQTSCSFMNIRKDICLIVNTDETIDNAPSDQFPSLITPT